MKKKKLTSDKIKVLIRRIIFFPFCLILSPLVWVFSSESYKEIWGEFLEVTEMGGFSI